MDLKSLRKEIDAIDNKIQDLIKERANLGLEVAKIKRTDEVPRFYSPEREAAILRRVAERNDSPLPDFNVTQIFREIISATRSLESLTRIAILGPEGTFTEAAARQHFGHAFEAIFQPTINDVFSAVEVDRAEFGVVPVENSTEGVVNSTLDCLVDSPLKLCGEVEMPIHHSLLSDGIDIKSITSVLAHPQAIAQCRRWLNRMLPDIELVSVSSNAEAVRLIKGSPSQAAIASEIAAKIHEVNVLSSNIEDASRNTTRFLVIGHSESKPTGYDKTSILISQKDQPGALVNLLMPFADRNINMSKLESRPSRQEMWNYVFFIDFEGHAADKEIVELFKEVKKSATLFKFLGSYPRCAR